MVSERNRSASVALVVCLMVAAACAKGNAQTNRSTTPQARPSTTAKLRILEPTNGKIFHGAAVTIPIRIELTGARIVPATTKNIRPDQGHIHVYLEIGRAHV